MYIVRYVHVNGLQRYLTKFIVYVSTTLMVKNYTVDFPV